MKILDFGCGNNKAGGSIGIDRDPNSQADIIHDLEKFPYPFEDNTFDLIICNNILEHLQPLIKVLEELYKISKPNALIKIRMPHCSPCSAWADITHVRAFNTKAWRKINKGYYSAKFKFEPVTIKLIKTLPRNRKLTVTSPRWCYIWENYLCYLIGGFDGLYVELKAVK